MKLWHFDFYPQAYSLFDKTIFPREIFLKSIWYIDQEPSSELDNLNHLLRC